jgi:hypothetical protein
MKFGRKGQGAMEYLMTYGWAILVVMVVGVVMWQMGIFNIGGGTATTASGFARLKPLLATAKYSASTGPLNVTFTNGAGGTVDVTSVKMTLNGVDADAGSCAGTPSPALPTDVASGNNFYLSCSKSSWSVAKGDPYVINVQIDYTVTVAGATVTRTDTGIIRGPAD